MAILLDRTAFEVSRAAEYFSLRELVTQTGQEQHNFANVVLKELLDNAIDAAEAAGINPKVSVDIDTDDDLVKITVIDNGPGISPAVVQKILNFDTRTSTKQAYRSPTRGAQGNALKTVIGIPFALTGKESKLTIISQKTRHDITVTVDPAGDPQVHHVSNPSELDQGTSFSIEMPSAHNFKPHTILNEFALLNPHLELIAGDWKAFPTVRLGENWNKVLPTDPTSPYWYTEEDFTRLVYSYIAEAKRGGDNKTLKQFIAEFRGLSGRKKMQDIARQFESIKYLTDLEGQPEEIIRLYESMKEATKPVSPSTLGEVGEKHFRYSFERMETDIQNFKYKAKRGQLDDGLPYVVEVAFATTAERVMNIGGVNHAYAYRDPFAGMEFKFKDRDNEVRGYGFYNMAGRMYDPYGVFIYSSFIAALHLVCPRLDFKDRGKTQPVIPEEIRDAAEQALVYCTRDIYIENKKHVNDWKRQEARERKDEEEERRQIEAEKFDKREAVFLEIPEAVKRATGDHTLPASYRSVFYKIRPLIQKYELKTRRTKKTGDNRELTLDHFRNLLKEYQQQYGPIPLIYAEPRGYLVEPHTGQRVDMGTREVAEYELPENLFNKILYVEKLGLLPVFQAVQLAERYDCAIIAGQGFAVDAVKELLSRVEHETDITICVLTDADPAGYEIRRTLQEETKYTPGHRITVCDFGLTIAEAEAWNLESERAEQRKRHSAALMDKFTDKEKEYFLPPYESRPSWTIRRVELNAFGSDELVKYVEQKFKEYGIQEKVYPGDKVVNDAAKKNADRRLEELIRDAFMKKYNIEEMTQDIYKQVKDGLTDLDVTVAVQERLQDNPPDRWLSLAEYIAGKQAVQLYLDRARELVDKYKP